MSDSTQNELLLERLIEWGCDVEGTLPRFVGDTGFYCRLLGMVPSESSFDALGSALAGGDVRSAFEQAHTLKGVLANMGLTPMYAEASEIVELLRGGTMSGTDRLYAELLRQKSHLESLLMDMDASD